VEHGITPTTVEREITDILQRIREPRGAYQPHEVKAEGLSGGDRLALIRRLEREMHEAADRLEFELAAALRDEVKELRAKR